MSLDDELLIQTVYDRPVLWNPADELHKNVNILQQSWQEVAQIINKPVKVLKSRWKNLRAYFYIQEKKTSDYREPPIITWPLYERLSFLKSISADSGFKEVDISAFSDQDPLALDVKSPMTTDSNSNSEPPRKRSYSEKNFDTELLELKRRKVELLERKSLLKAKSDDLLFFESLLPYMAQIPTMPKLRLRSAIQGLILHELQSQQRNNDPLDDNIL